MIKNEEFRLYGKMLQVLRTLFELKQMDVAELLGVKKQHISQAENNKRKLTRDQTLLLLNEMDISEETAIEIGEIIERITDRIKLEQLQKRIEQ